MKSQEDIEKKLEGFGKAWPEGCSIVGPVMQQIESIPVRPRSPKRRKIIVKSLIGIAASVAVFALVWWGVDGNRNSLYAQVIDAVHKARTIHMIQYAQPKDGAQPIKATEQWFERDEGFRMEGFGQIRIGNEEYIWDFNKDRNVATRSLSNGIDKATQFVFAQIDQLAQELQNEYKRYPEGDQQIDGEPCKAYLLTKTERIADSSLKSGERRGLIYLDQQSRLVQGVVQRRKDNHYNTESFISFKYDEPIDPALFKPDFGKDVKIVDADKAFDEFVDLKKAIYTAERDGIIIAVHRLERFENGGVMFVSSVRGAEETLKKYPLTMRGIQPGKFLADGPATNDHSTHSGMGGICKKLASATHQGIDIGWWAAIPHIKKPDYYETAPGKLKLNISVFPQGKFRESLTEKQIRFFDWEWEVEVEAPRPARISTIEEIAKGVYGDLTALSAIPFKSLTFSSDDNKMETGAGIDKITADEYVKKIVRDVKRDYEHDINHHINEQFEPKKQEEIRKFTSDRVAIALMYNPEVSDATLQRVAKRDTTTDLYLQGTHITDDGLKYLSGLMNLKLLDLSETGVTNAGLRHLTGLTSLKHLNVTDTKVTAEGVAMLKKEIPGIEIKWKGK